MADPQMGLWTPMGFRPMPGGPPVSGSARGADGCIGITLATRRNWACDTGLLLVSLCP